MNHDSFLAFDIGAESGRALLGTLEKEEIRVKEICRFQNKMISKGGRVYWDVHHLFEEITKGIRECVRENKGPVFSIGIDTWGVDFGLFDKRGHLLLLPFAYRDKRNKKAMEEFLEKIPPKQVYNLTGIQFLQFNSLFQLHALRTQNPEIITKAKDLLFMPDIFNYFLTGEMATEFSYATTSQLFNPRKDGWEEQLFKILDVPVSLMQAVETAGKILGPVKGSVAKETGVASVPVILTATHDTASAVAAAPARGIDWAFISSGTWSIMGIELDSPLISEDSYELNFTNEGGMGHKFRLSKNITGLWLLQECRKRWSERQNTEYGELIRTVDSAKPFRSLIDPDCPLFLKPADMTEAISDFCQKTGQPPPETVSEFVRCVLESLAFKYKYVFEELCSFCNRQISKVHIIGGGSRNRVLCQYSADALGLPVISGPAEATAVGNIMIQALSAGKVDSIERARDMISTSFDLRVYDPEGSEEWERNYNRFKNVCRESPNIKR